MLELKIITTRVCQDSETQDGEQDYVTFKKGSLVFPCGGGTALEVIKRIDRQITPVDVMML